MLALPNVKVPEPNLVKPPEPEIIPLKVLFPALPKDRVLPDKILTLPSPVRDKILLVFCTENVPEEFTFTAVLSDKVPLLIVNVPFWISVVPV